MTYEVEVTPAARRALSGGLPKAVAAAVLEFIRGPLAEEPYRVGKPLRDELEGLYSARRGEYRVIYEIQERRIVVRVVELEHRRHAYRT